MCELAIWLFVCVPLRSHKTALLLGNGYGNGCYFRQCGGALAGSIP